MSPYTRSLIALGLSAIGTLGLVALVFVTSAWRAGRAFGGRGIITVWMVMSLAFGGFLTVRTRQRRLTLFGSVTQHAGPAFVVFTLLGLVTLGLTSLSVRRRLGHRADGMPSTVDYLAGAGTLIGGQILSTVLATLVFHWLGGD